MAYNVFLLSFSAGLGLYDVPFSASKFSRPRPRRPNSSILSGRSVSSMHNLLLLTLSSYLLLMAVLLLSGFKILD